MTVWEAAGVLRCAPARVRRLVREGRLHAIRLGGGPQGRLRFTRADIEMFIAGAGAPAVTPTARGMAANEHDERRVDGTPPDQSERRGESPQPGQSSPAPATTEDEHEEDE